MRVGRLVHLEDASSSIRGLLAWSAAYTKVKEAVEDGEEDAGAVAF